MAKKESIQMLKLRNITNRPLEFILAGDETIRLQPSQTSDVIPETAIKGTFAEGQIEKAVKDKELKIVHVKEW